MVRKENKMKETEDLITAQTGIIAEIETAFFDIPFGNSAFQIQNFIINAQYTPERAYRAIGLTISTKIKALKEAYYGLKKENIDIEELQEKIADPATGKYDKARAELEIEKKKENRNWGKKLVNDALAELECLYVAYKKLPKLTRAEFEAGERKHFEIKLKKQAAGITGALESIDNMNVDLLEQNQLKEK
ncbi:MAG: hypothetical protein A2031_07980 [Deltaproteobacteria bacterium RBG_19FT_COMBO_43_11]|nr:MAG: hypothetical protein A2031_07980 [Deltaproteobacteria bacterium RBG_19FT_COMBO_43_11]